MVLGHHGSCLLKRQLKLVFAAIHRNARATERCRLILFGDRRWRRRCGSTRFGQRRRGRWRHDGDRVRAGAQRLIKGKLDLGANRRATADARLAIDEGDLAPLGGIANAGMMRFSGELPTMIPKPYRQMHQLYPEFMQAYEALGEAARAAGPLSPREVALVKLAISIGAGLEGAAHSHCRKALEAGCEADDLRHVALLSAPTIGFPPMMRARGWVEDVVARGLPPAAADDQQAQQP